MDIKAGDHIVIEGMTYDSYAVCRVVKIGKVMWEVEQLRWNGEYDLPAKRKVVRPLAYRGNDPLGLSLELRDRKQALWDKEAKMKAEYHKAVRALPGVEV